MTVTESQHANKKIEAEAAVARLIESIQSDHREPCEWEKLCLIRALDSIFSGLYWRACKHVELAYTVTARKNDVPAEVRGELAQLDIVSLRSSLEAARLEPVRRSPFFGPWTDPTT